MANENSNQIAIKANLGEAQSNVAIAKENARLMGDYMVPSVVKSHPASYIQCLVRQTST